MGNSKSKGEKGRKSSRSSDNAASNAAPAAPAAAPASAPVVAPAAATAPSAAAQESKAVATSPAPASTAAAPAAQPAQATPSASPTPPANKVKGLPTSPGLARTESQVERSFRMISSESRGISFDRRGVSKEVKDFHVDDVKYRKHFNPDGTAARTSSLEGLVRRASIDGLIAPAGGAKADRADKKGAVAVVDCFSTGAVIAKNVQDKGLHVVGVLSKEMEGLMDLIPEGMELKFDETIQHEGNDLSPEAITKTAEALKNLPWPIVAVIPGAETGVELADALSEYLGVRTNGTAKSEARRNKFVMGETVRKAGVRAVQQKLCSKWDEVQAFVKEMNPDPFTVVLKPLDSAGSDDVYLCKNIDEVKTAFGTIVGKVNGLGFTNDTVLVQEYLEGTEYVVDTVSLDGEHKVVAIWEYDRRPVNGMSFVCFGYRVVDANEERAQELMDYTKSVLDALSIQNGPGHAEVKWFKGAPCLVEIGARCHGGEGAWCVCVDEAVGYNQTQLAVDAYIDPTSFKACPDAPRGLKAGGKVAWLVSQTEGNLKGMNETYVEEIKSMSSFRSIEFFKHAGDYLPKTRDCFTWIGNVRMVNQDVDQLQKDYDRVQELAKKDLYDLEEKAEEKLPDAIAVVDPFSSGAVVASYINQKGLKCICVYSGKEEELENVANFIPHGLEVHFDATAEFDKEKGIEATIQALKEMPFNIVAVIPGAEPGVNVADMLADGMGLPTNGAHMTEARRNKYIMGETVRQAGVRAVQQKLAKSWDDVEDFLKDNTPEPFKLIVKPLDSAGSEDVILCTSKEMLKENFNRILGKTNMLGQKNNELLVQEYLEGKEYVVDSVSRNGHHKIVAVWEYDRREFNGAFTVCFGQRLLDQNDDRVKELAAYQKTVLDALNFQHGPGHGEVKWHKGGPCLVEVGSRCHGGEGVWVDVANEALGYNQAYLQVDCYVDPEKFDAVPDLPLKKKQGRMIFLCSPRAGTLVHVNHLEDIRQLESFRDMELFVKTGDKVEKTINVFTWVGNGKLVNEEESKITEDYEQIHKYMMEDMLMLQ